MAWITISESDLHSVISGDELDAYRSTALVQGQSDPVSSTVGRTIDHVRAHLIAGGAEVESGVSIPSGLLTVTLDLVVWEIMKRCALISDASGARKAAGEKAQAILDKVAEGKFKVESPTASDAPSQPVYFGGESKLNL